MYTIRVSLQSACVKRTDKLVCVVTIVWVYFYVQEEQQITKKYITNGLSIFPR